MTQTARPVSDIAIGDFVAETLGTTDLWDSIDDASDSTYIVNTSAGETTYECLLDELTDPSSSANHTVYVRHSNLWTEPTTYKLYQGTTLIATLGAWGHNGAYTDSYTLSAAEANSITDYTDLRVRCEDAPTLTYILDIWMEVPDASTPASVNLATIARTATINTPTVAQGSSITLSGAVVGSASVPSPTKTSGASVTPTTVAATTSIPLPSMAADDAGVSSPTTTGAATVPTPAISAGLDITPTTLVGAASVPVPLAAERVDASVTPTTVAATALVRDGWSEPEDATTGVVNIGVTAAIATTATVLLPVVNIHAPITTTTVEATTTIGEPPTTADADVVPDAVAAATVVLTAVASAPDVAVPAGPIVAVVTVEVPVTSAQLNASVTPTTVAASATVVASVVSAGASRVPAVLVAVAMVGPAGSLTVTLGGESHVLVPPPMHARIGEIGFALQSAEGVAAGAPAFVMGVADMLPMPMQNTTIHAPANGYLVTQAIRKGTTYWEVMSTVPAFPSGIGVALKGLLPSESGGGGTHTFTPATTDEWLTLFSTRPGPLYEKYTDGIVEQVVLSFESGLPVQMTINGKGRSAEILTGAYAPEQLEDNDWLTMIGATLRFDWDGAATTLHPHVEAGSVRLLRRLTVEPTADGSTPLAFTRGPLEAEVHIEMPVADYDGYRATFMGTVGGRTQSPDVAVGALDLLFSAARTPAASSLRIQMPSVAFMWDPPQPQVMGGAPRASITGYATLPDSGAFVTVTLVNGVPGSY